MYDLKPPAVFAHERIFKNPLATARMERMLDALGVDQRDVPVITHEDIDTVIEACGANDIVASEDVVRGGHGRMRQGHLKLTDDPVMIFNTFVWDEAERVPMTRRFRHPNATRTYRLLCGAGQDFAYSKRPLWHGESPGGYVCQGGWGIHTIQGCVHKCDYCGQGFAVTLLCDLEDFGAELDRNFAARPEQKVYRWDLYSDQVCFEPEYGGTDVVGGHFSRTDDKYLLLYTKSDNVDHLFDLPYQDHVLINWTISMDTVCREIERDTPSLHDRIAAMRKCQEQGYTIRAGFTPIIPVRNWREETTAMIEHLFDQCDPEVVRLWVVSMMEADEAVEMFGEDLLDPHALQRMREDQAAMTGKHHAPFPLDVRCDIYEWYLDELHRISPKTPVALCTETPEAWARLQPKLNMVPTNMFCCCGGTSTPGGWVGPLS